MSGGRSRTTIVGASLALLASGSALVAIGVAGGGQLAFVAVGVFSLVASARVGVVGHARAG